MRRRARAAVPVQAEEPPADPLNDPVVQQHPVVQFVYPPRVRERDPPIFQGEPHEDVVEWLARYQEIAEFNTWVPEQTFRHLRMSLDGVARKWFLSLSPPPVSFDHFKQLILGAFKNRNYEFALESQLRQRVQREGESAVNYCYDVIFLCSKIDANMQEEVKVQHLLRGLSPTLVVKIYPFLGPNCDTKELLRQVRIQSEASQLADRRLTQPSALTPQPVFNAVLPPSNPSTSSDGARIEQLERRIMGEINELRNEFKSGLAAERRFFLSVLGQRVPTLEGLANSAQSGVRRTESENPGADVGSDRPVVNLT